jgi:hypothetical protein
MLAVPCTLLVGAIIGIGFVAYPADRHFAVAHAVDGYRQSLNGTIIGYDVSAKKCVERTVDSGGSNCVHTELCDSYLESRQEAQYDANGKLTGYKTVWDTKWHDCPKDTYEYTYTLTAKAYNVYTFTIAQDIFGPLSRHIRGNDSGIPRDVPAQWQKAKDDLDAHHSDSMMHWDTYQNYILGSESKDLEDSSDDIQLLLGKKLLPSMVTSLHDNFLSDKVSFVGCHTGNEAVWQNDLMDFNAQFGTLKQGDMRVVCIQASALPASISPEDYIRALKAHWQSDFGKDALPKNAVVLVMAVDDANTTIKWARAETGMPIGNHEMLDALNFRLGGQPFDPDKVFGQTTATVSQVEGKPKVTYLPGLDTTPDEGIVPLTVMHDHAFKRACMGCTDENEKDQQGFVDLKELIPIPFWVAFLTVVIMLLIVIVLCAAALSVYGYFTGTTPEFWGASFTTRRSYDSY